MTDSERHPYIELIAREARRPVVVDPAARARVMAAVRAQPLPGPRSWLWRRIVAPRSFTLSPITGALLAASLVGIGVISNALVNRDGQSPAGQVPPVAQRRPVSDTVVKFVFLAPQASKVSLVGDFNDWDAAKSPMVRIANSGLWTVTLPLTAGRHVYAYDVDGVWYADPNAPVAGDDGFGHASSVRVVTKGSAL